MAANVADPGKLKQIRESHKAQLIRGWPAAADPAAAWQFWLAIVNLLEHGAAPRSPTCPTLDSSRSGFDLGDDLWNV